MNKHQSNVADRIALHYTFIPRKKDEYVAK